MDKKVLLLGLGVLLLFSVPKVLAAENYTITVDSIYSETESGLFTMLFANATRDSGDNDGNNVTFTISTCAFTWNPISLQYEGTISKSTPQTVTFGTLDAFASTEFVGETSVITQNATVTWTTNSLELWQQQLTTGNWVGGGMELMFTELTLVGGWSLIMAIFSIGIYNFSGPYAVFAVWVLGWGGFSTMVHGEALSIALIMMALGLGIPVAKLLIDRRTT